MTEARPIDRDLLGAYLLGLWGLPHAIMEAVAYHRTPRVVAHSAFELVDVIYVADHLAKEVREGTADEKLDLDYLAGLGIDEAQLEAMRVSAQRVAGAAPEDIPTSDNGEYREGQP